IHKQSGKQQTPNRLVCLEFPPSASVRALGLHQNVFRSAQDSSLVSSPLFTFSTAVLNAKPSLGFESIKRFRSAIGSRLSYCFRSSSETFRALASFAKISSEGNRLPSSMSERKGPEMPTRFANSRKDKSALSRNS